MGSKTSDIQKTRGEDPELERILVNSEVSSVSLEVAIKIAKSVMDEDSKSTVMIIDPAFEENQAKWKKISHNIGIPSTGTKQPITSSPIGHWINELANLGIGPNAFSMERLRLIALQDSLNPFSAHSEINVEGSISPTPDIELLANIARSEHILGGQGALRRWLEALSRTPRITDNAESRESTQLVATISGLFTISTLSESLIERYSLMRSSLRVVFLARV